MTGDESTGPTVGDLVTRWTVALGNAHLTASAATREALRERLRPQKAQDRQNVAMLAEGRIVLVWLAAAVQDPDWARKVVAFAGGHEDATTQAAIQAVYEAFEIPEAP